MPPKKRKTPSRQIPLTKAGLSIKSKGEKWKDADLLLTDDIYTRVPDEAKGIYFWYTVIGYDDDTNLFTLEYQKKAIDPTADGAEFVAFAEDTDEIILEGITMDSIKESRNRWFDVTTKTKTKRAEADRRDKVAKQLKEEARDDSKVDLSDIQKVVDTDVNGGKSLAIIALEFEEVAHEENDQSKKQRWKHKMSGREFWRYRSNNGKTWDTGVWNKQLGYIANWKGMKGGE